VSLSFFDRKSFFPFLGQKICISFQMNKQEEKNPKLTRSDKIFFFFSKQNVERTPSFIIRLDIAVLKVRKNEFLIGKENKEKAQSVSEKENKMFVGLWWWKTQETQKEKKLNLTLSLEVSRPFSIREMRRQSRGKVWEKHRHINQTEKEDETWRSVKSIKNTKIRFM